MSSEAPPTGGDDAQQEPTDFLSTQFVFGAGRSAPAVGLDVLVTKVAVDFVGLTSEAGDNCVKRNLEALRDATGVDAICIGLLDAGAQARRARRERHGPACAVRSAGAQGRVARAAAVPRRPARAPAHRRDCATRTRRGATTRSTRRGSPNSASAARSSAACRCNNRVCGFVALLSAQPRPDGWDANLHLMLKLVGSSFATGLERLRVQRYLAQARGTQRAVAAVGQRRPLGFRRREQLGLVLAALEDRCSATTSTTRTSRPTGAGSCTRTTWRACRR